VLGTVTPVEDPSEQRQAGFTPPPGACSVLVVRHGESEAAVAGRPFPLVDGQGDPGLHPAGRRQAELLADRLGGEPVAAVYVTTLRRTVETAAPLAARLGLRPIVEPRLREVHLGEWEGGLFRHRVAEHHPLAARVLAEERWDVIPGAEPAVSLDGRVRAALGAIATRHPDELVVAVTHGGVIGSAFAGADNASISQLVLAGDRWTVRCYNDTAHLGRGWADVPEAPT
jgi:probable phosphoglycerate mutase